MADTERTLLELLQAVADLPEALNNGALAQALSDLEQSSGENARKLAEAISRLAAKDAPPHELATALNALRDLIERQSPANFESEVSVQYDGITNLRIKRIPIQRG
jgi:predicted DNA-binding transcriptional regulator YafY